MASRNLPFIFKIHWLLQGLQGGGYTSKTAYSECCLFVVINPYPKLPLRSKLPWPASRNPFIQCVVAVVQF